jgi:hypothetical protein
VRHEIRWGRTKCRQEGGVQKLLVSREAASLCTARSLESCSSWLLLLAKEFSELWFPVTTLSLWTWELQLQGLVLEAVEDLGSKCGTFQFLSKGKISLFK